MEEGFPFTNLWDGDLPTPSRETGSRMSISTIVDAMCSLGPMAEETLGLIGKNRLDDALAKPNMINGRKSGGKILGEMWHLPKSHSLKSLTGPPTLRRAGSEPSLPTFLASEDGKGQEENEGRNSNSSSRSSSPDLYKLLDISWPWNSAPRSSPVPVHNINKNAEDTESIPSSGASDTSEDSLSWLEDTTSYYNSAPHDAEDAVSEETGSTTTLSIISLDVLWFLEDTGGTGTPGIPQHDAEVTTTISTSTDLKGTDPQPSEKTHDTIDTLDSPQRENTEFENIDEITVEESSPISSKDQSQEDATPSRKKHRRGWKGVRRRISHLFSSLFCCLLTPKTGDTIPRCPWCSSAIPEARNWCDVFIPVSDSLPSVDQMTGFFPCTVKREQMTPITLFP